MVGLALRRLAAIPVILLVASAAVFCLPWLLGGDVTRAVIWARSLSAAPDPAGEARVAAEMGLDRPVVTQYGDWLAGALRGDLGRSFTFRAPVAPEVLAALGVSLGLALLALAAALAVALATRLVRAETRSVLGAPATRTATAKGLPDRRVLAVHVLPRSLTSVAADAGPFLAGTLGGAVVVEVVFAIPGLGRLLAEAVAARDLPSIQGGLVAVVAVALLTELAQRAFRGCGETPRGRRRGRPPHGWG